MKPFSCATPCQLASIPNGGTYDASRVTPVLERLCPCSLPARPFLLDVGTAAAESRPDIVNWLRGSSHQMWRVLGYDPKPSNCRSIKRVIDRADPMGNRSRFLCAAVSDRKGVFELAESEGAEGSQLKDDPAAFGQTWTDGAQTFKASGRTRVPVVTLDSEVPGDAAVWMLKADVQGHEMQVLRGAIKLLRERRVAWMVLELDVFALKAASAPGRPSSGSELLGFLERHDFSCLNLRARTWRRAWNYPCPDERDTRHVNRTCAYSDLLCGHRSVSVPPAGWRAAVEREFCNQGGWGADLCSTPKGH